MQMKYLVILSSIISITSLPVDAHTRVGTVHGLLDGFIHPLIGLDHFLVMIAMGFLAVKQGGQSLLSICPMKKMLILGMILIPISMWI